MFGLERKLKKFADFFLHFEPRFALINVTEMPQRMCGNAWLVVMVVGARDFVPNLDAKLMVFGDLWERCGLEKGGRRIVEVSELV